METNETAGPPHSPDAEAWLERHGDALFRYALLRLADRAAAEDVVQETFLAALEAYGRFAGRSSVRTWLIGILKRKIIDVIRKAARERPLSELDAADTARYVDEHFTAKGFWNTKLRRWRRDAEQSIEQREFWDVFAKCLSRMEPKYSQAFAMRQFDVLSCDEICEILNMTATNLWTVLHRARSRLRTCLEQNWFGRKP